MNFILQWYITDDTKLLLFQTNKQTKNLSASCAYNINSFSANLNLTLTTPTCPQILYPHALNDFVNTAQPLFPTLSSQDADSGLFSCSYRTKALSCCYITGPVFPTELFIFKKINLWELFTSCRHCYSFNLCCCRFLAVVTFNFM